MTAIRRTLLLLALALPFAGCDKGGGGSPPPGGAPGLTIAMLPKSLGNQYFISCRAGAEKAARELGVKLLWDGPPGPSADKQNEFVESWITRGVDVIAVACENGEGIAGALKKARARGIKVVTWDADSTPDARDFFVNQATPEGIGTTLMDHAAELLGGKGEFAIITGTLTASNLNQWRAVIEKRLAEKYPDMKLAVTRPCDDKPEKALQEAKTIMSAHPDVKLIMAICSPSVPASAEAVQQAGRKDVKVIGLGLPNENRKWVKEGITDRFVLWNTADLGYLAVQAAVALKNGTLKPGDKEFEVKGMRKFEIQGTGIILGPPLTFNKGNIDQFDF